MKKSKLLLISWVLGIAYLIYLIVYFGDALNTTQGAEQTGVGIAATLVFPHAIAVLLAVVFNVLGWAMHKRGFALTGGILYAVSIALFPLYFMFVIIQMILSFVGYAKMKNKVSDEDLVVKTA